MDKEKVILWDFDGTLSYRKGMWSGVLFDVLIEDDPACTITVEELRPFLRAGFPWHQPDIAHSHITTAELWWTEIEQILIRAYVGVGLPLAQAEKMARLAHLRYIDSHGWFLYEDVLPTLQFLQGEGWEHVILSNHVPELSTIAAYLGLTLFIGTVISSALTGYEKPHPLTFRNALERLGNPDKVWMVGDNIEADILGAEAVGIPGILVRKEDERAARCCADLYGITLMIS